HRPVSAPPAVVPAAVLRNRLRFILPPERGWSMSRALLWVARGYRTRAAAWSSTMVAIAPGGVEEPTPTATMWHSDFVIIGPHARSVRSRQGIRQSARRRRRRPHDRRGHHHRPHRSYGRGQDDPLQPDRGRARAWGRRDSFPG